MTGFELFLLGRKLMALGAEAIPEAGIHRMAPSVRTVLFDVFSHPGSSISEITARTGFPQSLVSASVARLRGVGGLITETDAADHRRVLVRPAPSVVPAARRRFAMPVDATLAQAIQSADARDVSRAIAALEELVRLLIPDSVGEPNPETHAPPSHVRHQKGGSADTHASAVRNSR
jgi:DNA-binding MarR family transcriptional regulator